MKNNNIIDISDFVDVETQQKVIFNLVNHFKLRRNKFGFTQKKTKPEIWRELCIH